MRYTMQDKKTEFEGQKLITGINCQPESVYADFMTTKRLHHKTDGVLFYHMPGFLFYPKGYEGGGHVRLCFSNISDADIERGVQILSEALEHSVE